MTSENLQKAKVIVPCAIIGIGVICLVFGLAFPMPGEQLITIESSLDEKVANSFASRYFPVEEYFSGDSYNYMIGASILCGHIAGAMATKSIFVAVGLVLICLGCILLVFSLSSKRQSNGVKSNLPSL